MSYATIMVHAQPGQDAEPRLKLAANVANTFDAMLIGVGAEMLYPVVIGAFGETMIVEGQKAVGDDLKAAEKAFKAASRDVRKGAEWRREVDFPETAVARHSRAADLIVASPHPDPELTFFSVAHPGELLMQCGRPILVAPLHMTTLDAASIVIGWKDTREARRAVSDAMPFLKRAKQVLLVEVCEAADDEANAKARLKDVAAALARHGVKASTATRPKPAHGVAEDLVHVARVQEADLIVCGGYGHSRLREWVFGGVTDDFLTRPALPVLLSR